MSYKQIFNKIEITIKRIASAFCRFVGYFDFDCWLYRLIRDVLLGFIVLGVFLYALSIVSPWTYNQLTRWANSPALPDILECRIEGVLKSNHAELSAYSFSVTIEDPRDSIYDLVFLTSGPGISIYESGSKDQPYSDNRNVIVRRFVSSERSRKQKFEFESYVNHKEQGTTPFKVEAISLEECPADVAFKRKVAR
jgi:hypothetical protein